MNDTRLTTFRWIRIVAIAIAYALPAVLEMVEYQTAEPLLTLL